MYGHLWFEHLKGSQAIFMLCLVSTCCNSEDLSCVKCVNIMLDWPCHGFGKALFIRTG